MLCNQRSRLSEVPRETDIGKRRSHAHPKVPSNPAPIIAQRDPAVMVLGLVRRENVIVVRHLPHLSFRLRGSSGRARAPSSAVGRGDGDRRLFPVPLSLGANSYREIRRLRRGGMKINFQRDDEEEKSHSNGGKKEERRQKKC